MLWYGCTKSIAHISQFCRLNFIHLQCYFLAHIYKWFVFYLIVFLKASYGVLHMNSFLVSLVLNVGRWGRMNSARNPSREVWAQDLTWSLRYVLWQNTLLSQYISPPRDISEYLQIVREAWWIAWGNLAMNWHPHPRRRISAPSRFTRWKSSKAPGALGSRTEFTYYRHYLCLNHYRKAILSVKFSLHLEQISMVIGVDGQTGQAAA